MCHYDKRSPDKHCHIKKTPHHFQQNSFYHKTFECVAQLNVTLGLYCVTVYWVVHSNSYTSWKQTCNKDRVWRQCISCKVIHQQCGYCAQSVGPTHPIRVGPCACRHSSPGSSTDEVSRYTYTETRRPAWHSAAVSRRWRIERACCGGSSGRCTSYSGPSRL